MPCRVASLELHHREGYRDLFFADAEKAADTDDRMRNPGIRADNEVFDGADLLPGAVEHVPVEVGAERYAAFRRTRQVDDLLDGARPPKLRESAGGYRQRVQLPPECQELDLAVGRQGRHLICPVELGLYI